jgi:hypothetical protein
MNFDFYLIKFKTINKTIKTIAIIAANNKAVLLDPNPIGMNPINPKNPHSVFVLLEGLDCESIVPIIIKANPMKIAIIPIKINCSCMFIIFIYKNL